MAGIVGRVREKACALLRQGLAGGDALRGRGRCGEPIAIVDEGGELDSWFVPVLLDQRMAGFIQLACDLAYLRYAGFPVPVDPALWLDRDAVVCRAQALAGPAANLSAPVLSFDTSRSRIAWKVGSTTSTGQAKTIFVAGDFAYELQ